MVLTTRESFHKALAIAFAGTDIIYHRGHLMRDRQYGPNFLATHSVARAAWEAGEAGKVELLQRKETAGDYIYIARVRKPPHKAIVWTGCYDPRRHIPRDRRAA